MRRSASLGLLLFVALLVASWGCSPREERVATHRVEKRVFAHRVSAEGVLQAGRTTKVTVPSEVASSVRLGWLAPEGTSVEEGEVVARFDPRAMEEKLEDGTLDRSKSDRRIDQTTVQNDQRVEDLVTSAAVADLELGHAREYQKTDDLVFSRRELVEDAIDEELASQRREHALGNAETQKSLARTELDLLDIERGMALNSIEEAEQGLAALEVRAPHAGLLTYVRDWRGEAPTVGMEMYRGQPLGEIPDLDSIEAEVYVLEADAGGLEVGQVAEVEIESAPGRMLRGEVLRVEPVAQPRFRGSPVQYFGVVVAFDEHRPEDLAMRPGQRVRAKLTLYEVEDALVVPRQAVFEEDGESRVWVRRGGEFENVAVEIGRTGLGFAVVESGLVEGEEIALRPPGEGWKGEGDGSGGGLPGVG